ncbi:putative helicase MOV-10 [Phymastichus coffea]|uniref:putative helicase MOV-10 n=1 Tax=Phymastichus coffea TaxID=108790 RepID=UPI00273C0471|nr:putative helicase MOV-10 [Phymastichus coffea]
MSDRIILPEYPIPEELKSVLRTKSYSLQSISYKYAKIIAALRSAKCIDIQEKHYLQLLKFALYLEEHQNTEEVKKYRLFRQPLRRIIDPTGDLRLALFQIIVDNVVDEERPWIRPNDLVDVIDIYDNNVYTLRITKIIENQIIIGDFSKRLCDTHVPSKLYDIDFRFHNYQMRCSHYAITLMDSHKTVSYLFPENKQWHVENDNCHIDSFQTVNPNIASNPEQLQAIWHIVNLSSFPIPYILYGPPGTGKTATLVEAMCQILKNSCNNILVCTPSNAAGDEIARRLLNFVPPGMIYRMYSMSKLFSTVNEDFKFCSNVEKNAVVLPNIEHFLTKRIVITTLCLSARLIMMRIPCNHFSHVFIDEAGQGTECDMLIPISLVSECGKLHSQIVFAGDPEQLGPVIMSKLAKSILGRSILERLMSYNLYQKDCNNKYNPKYITKLLQNYRNDPAILHVSNHLFYNSELIAKRQGSIKFPIIFHGVEGEEDKCPISSSRCNNKELSLVLDYVDALLKNGLGFGRFVPKNIGIVTPFTLQSKQIKKELELRRLKDISVGTVELFQGQERDVIIMSTVRSKTFVHEGIEHVGFLSSPKRFNVAITRAKQLLVVIGNPNVLQIDNNWRYLIKFCIANNSCIGATVDLKNFKNKKCASDFNFLKSSVLFDNQSLLSVHSCSVEMVDLMDNLHAFD